jgi:hypothetical protein
VLGEGVDFGIKLYIRKVINKSEHLFQTIPKWVGTEGQGRRENFSLI